MKRFYLTLALLLSLVMGSYADNITSLDSLKNNQVYYITCAKTSTRGTWYFNPEHPDTMYSTKVAGVDADYENPNCQFAFLRSAKGFLYFYSIGGKKFMHATGDHYVYLTDTPVSSQNQLVKSSKNSRPWVAQDNGYHFNISGTQYCGLLSSWWSLSDEGNTIKIAEIDSLYFDPTDALAKIEAFEQTFSVVNITYKEVYGDSLLSTYTQQKVVNKGENVTFDGPQSFFCLKSVDATPDPVVINEDQNFTVTYNFVTDENALPFRTIASDATAFPDDTPWYFMTINGKYITVQDDGVTFETIESNDHPISRNALFCFNGDPIYGYYIHNMGTDDPLVSVYGSNVEGENFTINEEGTKLRLQHNASDGYEFNFIDSPVLYMSTGDQNNLYTYNNYEDNCFAPNTTINFIRLTDAEKTMLENGTETLGLDSISPAEGSMVGELDVIQIVFTTGVGKVAKDSEENYFKVYNQNGECVDKVTGYCDPQNGNAILVEFTEPLQGTQTYTIVIPENTIFGEQGQIAQGRTLTYKVIKPFEPIEGITGRIWNTKLTNFLNDDGCYVGETPYANMEYNEEGYYEVKVDVPSMNEIIVYGFDGIEGDDIDVVFDNDDPWGTVQTVNGESAIVTDGYRYWTIPSTKMDGDNQGYFWFYADSNIGGSMGHVSDKQQYGILCMTFYDLTAYNTFYIDFYLDNRYADASAVSSIAAQTPNQQIGFYNLAGQRMGNHVTKGIYIKNGKKVVIK